MYGLINSALREMIIENYGDSTWQKVLEVSKVPEDSFLTMRSYPDEVTYALAGAASEVLGAPVEDCLEMFGEYWILQTAQRSYSMLLDAAGSNMFDFLNNLDAMHDRITTTFLNFKPPSFSVEHMPDGHVAVHYSSEREGLSPFVTGLLKGIARRFGVTVVIHGIRETKLDKGVHCIFDLEINGNG